MDKKPTKAGAKKKRIKFKVVEPKTKPKPKMPQKKKNIKFVVKNTTNKKLDALKKKVEEQSKKDGIKRRVLPTGEVQRIKPKPKPAPKKKKLRVKQNVVEHTAFAGLNIQESLKEYGLEDTIFYLTDMFRFPNKFIKGYREYSLAEQKRIKKNLKEVLTKDIKTYKDFADKFKLKEPQFFKYMENHFKDNEREKSNAEFFVGKTKQDINKMDAAQVFGKLPSELRLKILRPKETGVKVAKTPPLPQDLAKELDNVIEEIKNTQGFLDFFDGWTYYEGGNFKPGAHEYFKKKSQQLDKDRYDDIIDNLFEKYKKLPAVIKSTIREYNMNNYEISLLVDRGEAPIFNDDYKYNNDYEDYNIEYRYGLTFDDGDYFTTNQTKSTVNSLVKGVREQMKSEKRTAKDVAKRIEKFMKENKLN